MPPIISKHPTAVCRHCEETARTSTRGEREGAAVERSQPVRRERSTSRTIGLLARGRREQYLSLRVSNNIRLPARICCPDGFVCSATFPPTLTLLERICFRTFSHNARRRFQSWNTMVGDNHLGRAGFGPPSSNRHDRFRPVGGPGPAPTVQLDILVRHIQF